MIGPARGAFTADGRAELKEINRILVDALGESPEAWRGAGVVIHVLALVGSADNGDDFDDRAAERLLVTMAAIMEGLVGNPAMPRELGLR